MKNKKRLAAKILKTSLSKVKFSVGALDEIKKAITRSDLRGLIAVKKITKIGVNSQSRVRARKIASQKSKGRRKGKGSKKGGKNSIITRKEKWMSKIRAQRTFLKMLKESGKLSALSYRSLYSKSKGGYFRNKRHIKLYITEHNLIESKETKK
tara:strand:- start:314 stop:772 length:459 start_codon:yes stop_codon:yes gene_type:complete